MRKKTKILTFAVALAVLSFPVAAGSPVKSAAKVEISTGPVLWVDPGNVATRDLFYGAGGKARQPRGKFTFVKEDVDGTQPKFVVRDENGAKWKVKLGPEARAETAATRFVWAVGYITDEDYLIPRLRVANMPRLRRGQKYVAPDGSMRNARFERHPGDAKKIDHWKWRRHPLAGTRELNGLRVMMAVINNWDLKDDNTGVYAMKDGTQPMHAVSDLGATFGSTRLVIPGRTSHLDTYIGSKFITKVTPEYIDFSTPGRPALITIVNVPYFIDHIRMRSIGKRIPREDARWISILLGRLSHRQIRSAFQAAGYSSAEVEGFAAVIQNRIEELRIASARPNT
jgi:hypothetical protein